MTTMSSQVYLLLYIFIFKFKFLFIHIKNNKYFTIIIFSSWNYYVTGICKMNVEFVVFTVMLYKRNIYFRRFTGTKHSFIEFAFS